MSRAPENVVKTSSSLYAFYEDIARLQYQISLGHLSADVNVGYLSPKRCLVGLNYDKKDLFSAPLYLFGESLSLE